MRTTALLLFVLILFSSCDKSKKTPNYVIPHEDMVNIIIDIHVTDGMLTINKVRRNMAKKDSLNYYEAIFKSFGYTRADFDTSIYYYSNHIFEYDKIYEEVLNKLSEKETEFKEESAREQKEATEAKEAKKTKDVKDAEKDNKLIEPNTEK